MTRKISAFHPSRAWPLVAGAAPLLLLIIQNAVPFFAILLLIAVVFWLFSLIGSGSPEKKELYDSSGKSLGLFNQSETGKSYYKDD